MTQWYYAIGRRKYGPVDIGEVKTLLAGKKLNPKSYVWNPAMGSEWKHISDAPELLENPMQPESSGQKTIGPNAGTNPLDQAPAKEMPKPKTYMNPATAYMISFTRAAADRDRDRKRKKYSLGRIFGSLFRIILLIAVLYGI